MSWYLPIIIVASALTVAYITIKSGIANRLLKIKAKMEMGIEIPMITFMLGFLIGLIL